MTNEETEEATLDLAKRVMDEGDGGEVLYAVDKRITRLETAFEEIKKDKTNITRWLFIIGVSIAILVALVWWFVWAKRLKPSPAPAASPAPEPSRIGFSAHSPKK